MTIWNVMQNTSTNTSIVRSHAYSENGCVDAHFAGKSNWSEREPILTVYQFVFIRCLCRIHFGRKSFAKPTSHHSISKVTFAVRSISISHIQLCCASFFRIDFRLVYFTLSFFYISNWSQSGLDTKMISFFKDEFDIYRKMLFRESQKSNAGMDALGKFVCVSFVVWILLDFFSPTTMK